MLYVVLITETILTLLIIAMVCLAISLVVIFVWEKLQTYYENWRDRRYMQKMDKEWEEYLQRKRKRQLHKKEMEKYPLFYWKELTNGNG